MTFSRILAATVAATALLGAAAPAFAGYYYYAAQDGPRLYQGRDIGGYVDRYGWPTPFGHCIKMCAHDNLPCDPVYFKIGDGRCTSDAR